MHIFAVSAIRVITHTSPHICISIVWYLCTYIELLMIVDIVMISDDRLSVFKKYWPKLKLHVDIVWMWRTRPCEHFLYTFSFQNDYNVRYQRSNIGDLNKSWGLAPVLWHQVGDDRWVHDGRYQGHWQGTASAKIQNFKITCRGYLYR